MGRKQIILFSLLALASIFSGLTFGLLDIFGSVDGRHAISFSLLGISAALLYVSLISIFILDIAPSSRIYSFILVASALFSTTFFFMNLNPLLTIVVGVSYCLLLLYAFKSTSKRFGLFVKFVPREIFFPVLRDSFIYLLVILSLIAYTQSQKLVSQNSLVSPTIIRIFFGPTTTVLNQQVNSQIQSEVGDILATIPPPQRREAVAEILEKTIESMADKKTGMVYGIPVDEIPIEKAIITDSGSVDLHPVFEGMLPSIAVAMNDRINKYALIAPIGIALLTFLIFQPLTIPLQFAESLLTLAIFKMLIASGFIHIHTESKEVQRLSL